MNKRIIFIILMVSNLSFAFCPNKSDITELNFQFAENALRTEIMKVNIEVDLQNQKDLRDFAYNDFKFAEKLYNEGWRGEPFYRALRSEYFEQEAKLASLDAASKGIDTDLLLWNTRIKNSCRSPGMEEELLVAFTESFIAKWQAESKVFGSLLAASYEEIKNLNSQIDLMTEQHQRGLFSYNELRNLRNKRERAYRKLDAQERTYRLQIEFTKQLESIRDFDQ